MKNSTKPSDKPPVETPSRHPLRTKIMNYILFFFVCALIGWLWEVFLAFLKTGTFVNRGVLHGPWLPIYGCGGAGILILFNRFRKSPILVFLSSAICCGLMEYATGWYLETFKHLKWWDYSALPFNLNGRICLLSLICFGFCGLIIVYLIYPRFHDTLARIAFKPKVIICTVLVLLFLGDYIYSSIHPNTGQGITSEISNILNIPSE